MWTGLLWSERPPTGMPTDGTWSDPSQCPFCGTSLPSPGAGFVDHVGDNPDCESAFEDWRDRVAGDVGGTWGG